MMRAQGWIHLGEGTDFGIGIGIEHQMLGGDFGSYPGGFVLTEQFYFFSGGEVEDVQSSLVFIREVEGEFGSVEGGLIVLNVTTQGGNERMRVSSDFTILFGSN